MKSQAHFQRLQPIFLHPFFSFTFNNQFHMHWKVSQVWSNKITQKRAFSIGILFNLVIKWCISFSNNSCHSTNLKKAQTFYSVFIMFIYSTFIIFFFQEKFSIKKIPYKKINNWDALYTTQNHKMCLELITRVSYLRHFFFFK